jgi:rare lipoprotein A
MRRGLALAVVVLALSACNSGERPPYTATNLGPAATPGHGIGIYKVGEPYQISGVWYYPTPDLNYDETGIATWYGPEFQETYTANGEVFDQNLATGAHKTLPLPSIVQVTNLENGRSIQVRVNDRGPYSLGRIIDLSRHAAQLLGFDRAGSAKVRVQLLVPETLQAQSLAKLNGTSGPQPPAETAPPAMPRESVVAQTLPPPNAPQPAPAAVPAAPKATLPQPSPATEGKPVPPGPPLNATVLQTPVHGTSIYIQAGAFSSKANADRMKAKLSGVGQVNVTPTYVNGTNLYRVRLGPIATVDDADALLTRAIGAGASEARIVVD